MHPLPYTTTVSTALDRYLRQFYVPLQTPNSETQKVNLPPETPQITRTHIVTFVARNIINSSSSSVRTTNERTTCRSFRGSLLSDTGILYTYHTYIVKTLPSPQPRPTPARNSVDNDHILIGAPGVARCNEDRLCWQSIIKRLGCWVGRKEA